MKILLLNISSYSFFYDQIVIPFGLASLGSYVENEGYIIKGIDMNTPSERIPQRYLQIDNELLGKITNFSPNIVAMSSYASNIYNIIFWSNTIKRALPQTFIVVGGNHASYIARELLEKCLSVDAVVRFEGEIPFKMICEHISKNNYDFSDVPNLLYRSDNIYTSDYGLDSVILENEIIPLINDINSLPNINRCFFERKYDTKYLKVPKYFSSHADIITARGCPFHCTFCDCNHYWNKTYRVRSVESVVEELKQLKQLYPNLKTVRFRDESLTINKDRCIELCDAIVENGIELKFQAHSRLDGLDEKVIRYLCLAGFEKLFIGLESGSQEVLKRLKKGIDISKAKEIISLLRVYGIKPRISFLIATRDETVRESLETIKLIKSLKLKKDEFYIGNSIQIYPGTGEYQKFIEENSNYEWITKKHNFNGKYFADRDPYGNIIQPSFRQYGLFKVFFMYWILSHMFAIKSLIRLIAGKFFKNKFVFKNLGSQIIKFAV